MTSANRFSTLFKSPAKIESSYSDAFPSLLGMNDSNTIESSPPKEEGAKNIKTKIILGPRSYEDELRERQQETLKQRTEAYGILADREKLGKSLLKTRMCNSIDKGEPCPHEGNCRFAHNLSELNIPPCLFGENCRFVREQNGKLFNKGEKVCNHKHPHESTDCFLYRVGLNRYKNNDTQQQTPTKFEIQAPPPLLPIPAKFEIPPQPPIPAKFEIQASSPPRNIKAPLLNSVDIETKAPNYAKDSQILVIRVPRELAARALEIALNSGKTNIQVEFTN